MIYFWDAPVKKTSGGGFHFLAGLQTELNKQHLVTSTLAQADAILVDSYHGLFSALNYKLKHPSIHFILRYGPVFQLHRAWFWRLVDQLIILTANHFADLVIFQSQWSLQQALRLGFNIQISHGVIYNGVNPEVFYPATSKSNSTKIRLIATSWSNNKNKGFGFLEYLDSRLDWEKYEAVFIGNSPVTFTHIKHIPALPPAEVAEQLRSHDIYIAGMRDDACSNALLEAQACGLRVVALRSGANPELISSGDTLFTSEEELVPAIRQTQPTKAAQARTIRSSATQYQKAIEGLHAPSRRISLWYYLEAFILQALFYVFHHLSSLTAQ